MKRWYAVYTQPRNELLASEHLARQGFGIYLPRYPKRRSHARRVDVVPAPLFPRYLFIEFNSEVDGWSVIRSTRGVIDLVRNGRDPVPVADTIIEQIKRREDEHGLVVLGRFLNLKPGARVRIDAGPFADCEAIFESKRDDERVMALLSLLGRKVVVNIPVRDLTIAE
jgi:transcriptional antiterminator RfaH